MAMEKEFVWAGWNAKALQCVEPRWEWIGVFQETHNKISSLLSLYSFLIASSLGSIVIFLSDSFALETSSLSYALFIHIRRCYDRHLRVKYSRNRAQIGPNFAQITVGKCLGKNARRLQNYSASISPSISPSNTSILPCVHTRIATIFFSHSEQNISLPEWIFSLPEQNISLSDHPTIVQTPPV